MNLINKYRPKLFKDVVGHPEVIESLQSVLKDNQVQAFIFTGPAGTGKTTLARLIALKLKCDPQNITEVDAASYSGVSDMREVTASMKYKAMGSNPNRAYIIDEAWRLSPQAWASLLKSVEEPPEHVYWFFCSSEALRIPEASRTRCAQYALTRVDKEVVFELLQKIAKAEKFTTSEDVLYLLAEKCNGSPRLAISGLAQCHHCKSRKQAAAIIKAMLDEEMGDIGKLIQAIAKGQNFTACCKILQGLEGNTTPENIRMAICSYFGKVAMGAKTEERAQNACAVIQAFQTPYPTWVSSFYPVVMSLAELLL